jgi:hypothetical protein
VWNRVAQGSQKLNYFMAVQIVNVESHFIMERAIEQFNIKEVPPWPGKDFEFAVKGKDPNGDVPDADLLEMEAALALLGTSSTYTDIFGSSLTILRVPERSRRWVLPHPTSPSAWLEVHLESQDLDGWRRRVGKPQPPILRLQPCTACRAADAGRSTEQIAYRAEAQAGSWSNYSGSGCSHEQ